LKNKITLQFNIQYFFGNRKKVYLYLATGFILLFMYALILFIFHTSNIHVPRPFHVITYNLDQNYKWVYWFLIPFISISALAVKVHTIPINIRIRMNNHRQALVFYYIQISLVGLWGTFLIGLISFVSFPLAQVSITINDLIHIFFLMLFCYLNSTNIGLFNIVLAKRFSEQISFLIVLLIGLCDQFLFKHVIFMSTKLLYRPEFSLISMISALFENFLLMFVLLLLLLMQLQQKGEYYENYYINQ
jgi:hypothetical protein